MLFTPCCISLAYPYGSMRTAVEFTAVTRCGGAGTSRAAGGLLGFIRWENTVTLVAEGNNNYRLILISNSKLNVTYHTKRNSTIPVDEPLTPLAGATRQVRQYRFLHHFTRTTSWMGSRSPSTASRCMH